MDEKQRKQQWNTKRKVGKAIPTATIDNATIFPVIVISILFNMLKFEPCWLWIVALKTFMRSTWLYGKPIRDKMRNKQTISRWTSIDLCCLLFNMNNSIDYVNNRYSRREYIMVINPIFTKPIECNCIFIAWKYEYTFDSIKIKSSRKLERQ